MNQQYIDRRTMSATIITGETSFREIFITTKKLVVGWLTLLLKESI